MINAKEIEENKTEKDQRSLQENWRYPGNSSCKDQHNKGQKYGKDLREAKDIKNRWQEYTEELYQNKKVLMTQKTTLVWSLIQSQTP